jgi:hypothetical protein
MTGCPPLLLNDCGGLEEGGDIDEYGSESDGIVSPELDRSGGDGDCSRSVREVIVVRAGDEVGQRRLVLQTKLGCSCNTSPCSHQSRCGQGCLSFTRAVTD